MERCDERDDDSVFLSSAPVEDVDETHRVLSRWPLPDTDFLEIEFVVAKPHALARLATVFRAAHLLHADEARLRLLAIPEQPGSLTLVYSDTDDGKTQKRLLATSPIKMGKGHTLGRLHRVSENIATCATEEGSLNVRPTPRDPSQPALR